ncbi:MAG: PA2169 family four-helix-bundle protein [Croceibacterium sp.]
MDNGHVISVLNGLIETTLDSVKGFAEASEDAEGSFTRMFSEMAQERRGVATRLQSLVAGLGGDPEEHSSLGAAAHRGFMNLKEAVMGSSDRAVVEEVERGEDYIKAKYEAALEDTKLSAETRQAVQEAMQSVRKGHDKASALKHSIAL